MYSLSVKSSLERHNLAQVRQEGSKRRLRYVLFQVHKCYIRNNGSYQIHGVYHLATTKNETQYGTFLVNTEGTCGVCETFSKAKFGYCPVSQVEISRDHPACGSFRTIASNHIRGNRASVIQDGQSNSNSSIGLHVNSFRNPEKCHGPRPEYCTTCCDKYWSCQLVLDEARKKT